MSGPVVLKMPSVRLFRQALERLEGSVDLALFIDAVALPTASPRSRTEISVSVFHGGTTGARGGDGVNVRDVCSDGLLCFLI